VDASVEGVEKPSSVNGNLVQIVGSVKVGSALPDVADFRNEMHRKLALDGQIPLVHRGVLDVWIECPYRWSLGAGLSDRDDAAEGVIVGVGTVTGNPVEIRAPGLVTSAGAPRSHSS